MVSSVFSIYDKHQTVNNVNRKITEIKNSLSILYSVQQELLKDYFTSSLMSCFEITRSAGISPQIIDITSVQAITIITILGERFEKYANSLLAYVAFTLRKRMQRNEIITPVRAAATAVSGLTR